jgi:hypothetical protein
VLDHHTSAAASGGLLWQNTTWSHGYCSIAHPAPKCLANEKPASEIASFMLFSQHPISHLISCALVPPPPPPTLPPHLPPLVPLFAYLSHLTMPKPKQFLKENKKKSKHAPSVGDWARLGKVTTSLTGNSSRQRQMSTWQVRNVRNRVRASSDGVPAGVDFEEAGEKWRGGDATKVCSPKKTRVM